MQPRPQRQGCVAEQGAAPRPERQAPVARRRVDLYTALFRRKPKGIQQRRCALVRLPARQRHDRQQHAVPARPPASGRDQVAGPQGGQKSRHHRGGVVYAAIEVEVQHPHGLDLGSRDPDRRHELRTVAPVRLRLAFSACGYVRGERAPQVEGALVALPTAPPLPFFVLDLDVRALGVRVLPGREARHEQRCIRVQAWLRLELEHQGHVGWDRAHPRRGLTTSEPSPQQSAGGAGSTRATVLCYVHGRSPQRADPGGAGQALPGAGARPFVRPPPGRKRVDGISARSARPARGGTKACACLGRDRPGNSAQREDARCQPDRVWVQLNARGPSEALGTTRREAWRQALWVVGFCSGRMPRNGQALATEQRLLGLQIKAFVPVAGVQERVP